MSGGRLLKRATKRHLLTLAVLGSTVTLARAQEDTAAAATDNELAEMSLDELMTIDVTSVAGVKQEWFRTPAAITVLRREDIKSAGHLTLAETLRLVPGVHVARANSNLWSISSRGFNGVLANKQLVMIDGRVVYDPFFSGVLWDVQQPMLEDIDRIEVIRGPGATLWGSNAVNGVINVTTLTARQTQGVYVSGVAGVQDVNGMVDARYGGKIDENVHYRLYGRFMDFGSTRLQGGGDVEDQWNMHNVGFRLDAGTPGDITFNLLGEYYNTPRDGSSRGFRINDPASPVISRPYENHFTGGHLTARLAHEEADQGWQAQLVFDEIGHETNGLVLDGHVLDFDVRQHFKTGERNEIVFGLGVRQFIANSDTNDDAQVVIDPANQHKSTLTAFVQNTYAIVPDRVFWMVGSKVEHNDYSGFEIEPSSRLWWTPSDKHTVWAAISRSVRVPSLIETSTVVVLPSPMPPVRVGNEGLEAEVAWTYEAGYRTRLTRDVTLDLASYYARYSKLISTPSDDPAALIPTNDGEGSTYGAEFALQWRPSDRLTMTGSYSYGRQELDDRIYRYAASMPENMIQLGADYKLTDKLTLDSHAYYVDHWDTIGGDVPSYIRLDMGLRWKPTDYMEVSLWGQNLLDGRHLEADGISEPRSGVNAEIGRSAYVQVELRF